MSDDDRHRLWQIHVIAFVALGSIWIIGGGTLIVALAILDELQH